MILLIAFAFLAGVITVLSPCILPILPIILTSSIGGQNIGKSRPLGVVIGFVLSFTFFTLFLSTIVRLSGIPADTLRLVSVLVIAGFGVSLLIPQFQLLVERLFSKLAGFMPASQNRTGFGGGLLIGLSVGLLWTPCVGPILASVISLAITGTVTFDAFLITLAYSLGTAIPMFLIILGGQNALKRVPWLLANLNNIQKLFGVLMILTAIGIFFNVDRKFQSYILEKFPQYGVGLIKLEYNETVKKQLEKNSGKKLMPQAIQTTTSSESSGQIISGKFNKSSFRTDEQWRKNLTPEQYHILREAGTEIPFTGGLNHENRKGTYYSAGCDKPIFRSEQKYDSGTGWPSFWAPINEDALVLRRESTLGDNRIEVLDTCGGHLGHVFDDGPPPTGKRFCMNSIALKFVPDYN